MKRYFNHIGQGQVVMVEFEPLSIIRTLDICTIFGTNKDIVEISKNEYLILRQQYQKQNTSNMSITITQ